MTSLVLALQSDVLAGVRPVSALLRTALAICRKLDLDESLKWIQAELNGYDGVPIPPYRQLTGTIRAENPYHGSVPIIFTKQPELAELLSLRPIGLPVPELEALLADPTVSDYEIPYPPDIEARLARMVRTRPTLHVPRSSIVGILDHVRTALLEWACKLEADGILGEGVSFSPKEVSMAAGHTYNIQNYIHSATSSTVQQASGHSVTQTLSSECLSELRQALAELRSHLASTALPGGEADQIGAQLATMDAQLTSPAPAESVLRVTWGVLRPVLEHAVGHVVGTSLYHEGPRLLALVSRLLG